MKYRSLMLLLFVASASGCATEAKTTLPTKPGMPTSWVNEPSSSSQFSRLPSWAKEEIIQLRAEMALARQNHYYRYWGKYPPDLEARIQRMDALAQDAYLTSNRTVFNDLTPELMTLTERPVDVTSDISVNTNSDIRSFWTDLGRVFMLDTPSRLSPYPIVNTTGNP